MDPMYGIGGNWRQHTYSLGLDLEDVDAFIDAGNMIYEELRETVESKPVEESCPSDPHTLEYSENYRDPDIQTDKENITQLVLKARGYQDDLQKRLFPKLMEEYEQQKQNLEIIRQHRAALYHHENAEELIEAEHQQLIIIDRITAVRDRLLEQSNRLAKLADQAISRKTAAKAGDEKDMAEGDVALQGPTVFPIDTPTTFPRKRGIIEREERDSCEET